MAVCQDLRYENENMRDKHKNRQSNHETIAIYESRGLHKAFNKDEIPLLEQSNISSLIKRIMYS